MAREEMEYGKKSFSELASDEPSELGGKSESWQDENIGRPVRARLKAQEAGANKVYDLFPEEEIGKHFTRSGSPGGSDGEEVE